MKKPLRFITETGVMLALLIALQSLTGFLGQYVTGSCVNTVLAVTVLFAGLHSGITVAIISPWLAYLLGIAQQVTVPAIMVGNSVFVIILYFVAGKNSKNIIRQVIAWVCAAAAKFAVLYAIVGLLICGVLADSLVASGTLNQKMLTALPHMFSWPQLVTALIGGGLALLIAPALRKALKR